MEKHKSTRSAREFLEIQGFRQIPGHPTWFARFQRRAVIILSRKGVYVTYNLKGDSYAV